MEDSEAKERSKWRKDELMLLIVQEERKRMDGWRGG